MTTSSYGVGGSYRVEPFDWKSATAADGEVLDASGRLNQSLRGRIGESFVVHVTGHGNAGAVWGTDMYTDDSATSTAAVHAGVLKPGETGLVKITIVGAGFVLRLRAERRGESRLSRLGRELPIEPAEPTADRRGAPSRMTPAS